MEGRSMWSTKSKVVHRPYRHFISNYFFNEIPEGGEFTSLRSYQRRHIHRVLTNIHSKNYYRLITFYQKTSRYLTTPVMKE